MATASGLSTGDEQGQTYPSLLLTLAGPLVLLAGGALAGAGMFLLVVESRTQDW
jgi:hypothetical protein